jgi:predicted peptidase
MNLPDVGVITYGISAPDKAAGTPLPLVLALHPGGERMPYYGSRFMAQVVQPALAGFGAIVIAPDCPVQARGWGDPRAERAVMALIDQVRKDHPIDPRRILVTGFSMGGRGTWFMASRHGDLFTAAIPMAASIGDEPVDGLGTIPTYIIHSRDDQVVPFAPAERNARELERLGRSVKFEELRGIGHYEMTAYVDALRRAGQWVFDHWK